MACLATFGSQCACRLGLASLGLVWFAFGLVWPGFGLVRETFEGSISKVLLSRNETHDIGLHGGRKGTALVWFGLAWLGLVFV